MQDRGLAGAVRSDQAQRLPCAEPQVDAVQDLRDPVAGDEPVDAQQGIVARQRVEALANAGAGGRPLEWLGNARARR